MNMYQQENIKLLFLISASLLFLSLNSIFCKVALLNNYIDAYSFTFYRIFFATLTLLAIFIYKNKKISFSFRKNWISGFMLFLYAICFSYAYISIDAGLGALLLFAVVQLVMLLSSVFFKEHINFQKILGIVVAFSGLVYLLYPSEDFELSYVHSFLMIISGVAWALYSVFGKSSDNALFNTMDNFIKALIFVIIFYVFFVSEPLVISVNGLIFAFISGSITSAIGYVMWYWVVSKLQIITSSIIQLLVPVLAIFVSIIFLSEKLTSTLFISILLISLGIVISVVSKKKII